MPKNKTKQSNSKGFTLVELIVTIFVFAVLSSAFIAVISTLNRTVKLNREKTVLSNLASKYLEVVRNLPFSQIGTIHGVPTGNLPDEVSPYTTKIESVSYNIYYQVSWIDDPADGTALLDSDANPTDYKQIKMMVQNLATGQITSYVTTAVPKGLEGNNNAGTLIAKVFNASGQPVEDATVVITGVTNSVNITLTTDALGQAVQVGLAPGVNAYHVVVTKDGYSSDQTYPITAQNPNPTKPDPTIAVGQVTLVSFSIDLLSTLTIKTLDSQCLNLNGIGVNVAGSKIIGTGPNVYKFNADYISGPVTYPSGRIILSNLEWDIYTPSLTAATLQTWNIKGTSPIQSINVLPGASQTFTIILTESTAHSMLVIVKDAVTGSALEGAIIEFQKGGSNPQDYFGISGGSVWTQNDFTGNSGVAMWATTTPNTYWQASGGIYINNGSNDVELQKVGGHYLVNSTSTLESSTFDTGTGLTDYSTITWAPTSQTAGTWLGFQVAANNDNATWNYVGPDGTAKTYYTVPGSNISGTLDNNQYFRFKAYLTTSNTNRTPVFSNIQINYVSGCQTPGQWLFDDITPSQGTPYTLTVTLPGYQTQVISGVIVNGNGNIEVDMVQ